MRLVVAQCQVDYAGRLTAHLPMATRLILLKADGSVSIHADDRAYKPLNWMNPPCTLTVVTPAEDGEAAASEHGRSLTELAPDRTIGERWPDHSISHVWLVRGKDGDTLRIAIAEVYHDSEHALGADPGLRKDGVEAHLQALLAENPTAFGPGYSLVQREYLTAIGPVDLLLRDDLGAYVAVEVKRRGEIDGVEQLTRYLELLNRDTLLRPVHGVFAAQQIKPQARVLAGDRGITCVTVDYDALRGLDHAENRLF